MRVVVTLGLFMVSILLCCCWISVAVMAVNVNVNVRVGVGVEAEGFLIACYYKYIWLSILIFYRFFCIISLFITVWHVSFYHPILY